MHDLTRRLATATLCLWLLANPHRGHAAAGCDAGDVALEAQPRPVPQAAWKARVDALEQQMTSVDLSHVRLLFLGDSITQGWYDGIYDQFYQARRPLNLGVLSDNTQGLLWRLARTPLGETLRPQLVVLLIGTNDLWPGVNPANVVSGIAAVVAQIRRRSPASHILLLGLLPRGATRNDPFRAKVQQVNAILAQRCTDDMVSFADPGTMLLDGAGGLSTQIAYDYLHPTWLGYAILAAAIEPDIRQVLGSNGGG